MGDALYPKEKVFVPNFKCFFKQDRNREWDKYYDSVQRHLNHHFHDRIDLRSNSMCFKFGFYVQFDFDGSKISCPQTILKKL